MPPPVVNVTAFNDVYILTLPSFTWVKVYPDHHGNATGTFGHYSATCNMVKSYSQMMVIGGALILAVSLDQIFIGAKAGKGN